MNCCIIYCIEMFNLCCNKVSKFIIENFLMIVFIIGICCALSCPSYGITASSYKVGKFGLISLINNVSIFLVSGLTLKVEALSGMTKKLTPYFYSLFCINFLSSLSAYVLLQLPVSKPFIIGMVIFSCVPTTLGVWFKFYLFIINSYLYFIT